MSDVPSWAVMWTLSAGARGMQVDHVARGGEWLAGAASLAGGAWLFFAAARIVSADAYITGWIGMVGLVLRLHFGALHLLSCAWRTAGVRARPLMNRPLAASSLADFWGRHDSDRRGPFSRGSSSAVRCKTS